MEWCLLVLQEWKAGLKLRRKVKVQGWVFCEVIWLGSWNGDSHLFCAHFFVLVPLFPILRDEEWFPHGAGTLFQQRSVQRGGDNRIRARQWQKCWCLPVLSAHGWETWWTLEILISPGEKVFGSESAAPSCTWWDPAHSWFGPRQREESKGVWPHLCCCGLACLFSA